MRSRFTYSYGESLFNNRTIADTPILPYCFRCGTTSVAYSTVISYSIRLLSILFIKKNRVVSRKDQPTRESHRCAFTVEDFGEIMEVLPCPVNVDFSNTRGKHTAVVTDVGSLLPPAPFCFNRSFSFVECSALSSLRPNEPLFSADNSRLKSADFCSRYDVSSACIALKIRF